MTRAGTMSLSTQGDREIVITRDFRAPRALVWDAYTKPEILRRWLGVSPTVTMPVCEIDLRVGGRYAYQWARPKNVMWLRGTYLEVVPQQLIVCTEEFEPRWYEGDGVGRFELTETGSGSALRTTVRTTVRYDSDVVRAGVLKTPMEQGLAAGFNALEDLMAGEGTG